MVWQNAPKLRTGWQRHALVLDVAAAAATIAFGAGLSGEGELLVSELAFEEVGSDVPVTAGPIAHGSRRTSTSARASVPLACQIGGSITVPSGQSRSLPSDR